MAEFVLHTSPSSPFGRAVMMMLEEKGADWSLVPLRPGAARSEAHLARHPFGKMPVLEHGDFSLYEAQAILRYLESVFPIPALVPSDVRERARMDQLIGINDWYLFPGCVQDIVFEQVIAPRYFGRPCDQSKVDAAVPRAHVALATLSRFLGDRPYLTGEQVSLADLMIAPQLSHLAQTSQWRELTEPRGNLVGWLQRMSERPSFKRTAWEAMEREPPAAE